MLNSGNWFYGMEVDDFSTCVTSLLPLQHLRFKGPSLDLHYFRMLQNTVEPAYNDIGLYDTSYIASDILWYQLIPHC
jgi:hypothetical protein